MLHVSEGDCLELTSFGEVSLYEKVACGAGAVPGAVKVVEVVAGKADRTLCAGCAEPRV